MPPQTHLCSELWKPQTMCSSVLTSSSPCRTFYLSKGPTPSLNASLLVWTSCLYQILLQIVYHLFPCQPCVPPTHYRLLKQFPIPEKPWNCISMDFIEKLPPSSGYTQF